MIPCYSLNSKRLYTLLSLQQPYIQNKVTSYLQRLKKVEGRKNITIYKAWTWMRISLVGQFMETGYHRLWAVLYCRQRPSPGKLTCNDRTQPNPTARILYGLLESISPTCTARMPPLAVSTILYRLHLKFSTPVSAQNAWTQCPHRTHGPNVRTERMWFL